MNYNNLISGMKRFGANDEEICFHVLGIASEKIHEDVVITLGWEPDIVPGLGKVSIISSYSASLDNVYKSFMTIGFCEIKGMGF